MLSIAQIELWIKAFATQVPLEVFVFVGSFFEELIAPIPSPLIMTTAGALALIDDRTLLFVLWLSVVGALGKTLGAWLYYIIGDKLEDVTLRKYGRWLGIRHEDMESIGQRFGKNHWKDGGALFALRVIPFFPSSVISFVSGVIKLNLHVYLWVTLIGSFIKDFLYAYTGFAGVTFFHRLWQDAERIRWGLDALIAIAVLVMLFLLYVNREVGVRYLTRLINRASHRS